MSPMPIRPRRLRQSAAVRALVREHEAPESHLLVELVDGPIPRRAAKVLAPFGGAWLHGSDDEAALVERIGAVRRILGEGCIAVDVRVNDAPAPDAALRAHEAGADLIAVAGADTHAVRKALEGAGAVNAVLVACASFDLDSAGRLGSPSEEDFGLWEAAGADIVLVEPALVNLHRVAMAVDSVAIPVAARCTPQEAAMFAAVFKRGWLDADSIAKETLTGARRAGARFVVAPSAWLAPPLGGKA